MSTLYSMEESSLVILYSNLSAFAHSDYDLTELTKRYSYVIIIDRAVSHDSIKRGLFECEKHLSNPSVKYWAESSHPHVA